MAKLDQESLKCAAQVRLESHVLLQDLVDEVSFGELERGQMRKVHLHGGLLGGPDLLCLLHVEPDRLTLLFVAVGVVLVVRVVFTQLEAIVSQIGRGLTCEGS